MFTNISSIFNKIIFSKALFKEEKVHEKNKKNKYDYNHKIKKCIDKNVYSYSKECICRRKNNKNLIFCLGKCGNYNNCTNINCYKLYVDSNDKLKLMFKPKNDMMDILMSDELMDKSNKEIINSNCKIKKSIGKSNTKKTSIDISDLPKDSFLNGNISFFNENNLFDDSDVTSNKYLTNIISKTKFLLKSNSDSNYTSFIFNGKKYIIPFINNQVLWGREVFNWSSNDEKNNYKNIFVEINLFVQHKNEFGRLIFLFKKNENMKMCILPGLCPLMFTKHCDQQDFFNYFKNELKSNLIFEEDGSIIDEFFCNLSFRKCNVLTIKQYKNIFKKIFKVLLVFLNQGFDFALTFITLFLFIFFNK